MRKQESENEEGQLSNISHSMKYLVIIETQKVKSYLFASPTMRETRGASILLDLLNRKQTRELLKEFTPTTVEEIYLGGGSGRVLFEKKTDAEVFKQTLEERYRRVTVNAKVSIELFEGQRNEAFPDWVSRGVGESRKNKLGKSECIPLLGGRWIMPCSSCGREPAERSLQEHGAHRLCRACMLKRESVNYLYQAIKPGESRERKRRLKSSVDLADLYSAEFIFTTLVRYCEARKCSVALPQDFSDIGKASRPANYMGLIYADGNRMGETVKDLGRLFPRDEDARIAYRAFSEIVDQATREAAVEAVLETVTLTTEGLLPVEFIMAGGDDLILAVPAHNTLDVAIVFMKKYQEKTANLQKEYLEKGNLAAMFAPEGLTTSAGVVIAHAGYPASDLMSMSAELMKIAKKKSSDGMLRGEQEKGTVDFMIISESVSETIKDRRKKEYSKDGIVLTEKPYTLDQCRWLLDTIRAMKEEGVPRTKLKALYSSLFQNPLQAQFDALRIKERLKATGSLQPGNIIDRLFVELDLFPFRRGADARWTTPLADIIEIYDYVQPEKGAESSEIVSARFGGGS